MTRDIVGQVDATKYPRYAEPSTFARLPRISEVPGADVGIVGVPFDSGVSYRPGARFGPAHVRAGSKLLRPFNPALGVEPFAPASGGRLRRHRGEPVQHRRGHLHHRLRGHRPA